ncbi:PE-PGRS family protein [Phenylobacterium zucineum HLK1]|uniref:PE-PGRS family protein n=1 Tax=Phenylobacterium zucineum (strain HLK1) TaxID=450851 RepID=B4RF91_PHEZH|nr:PE-PGRS family protein [Phenylobacterium zucineum HLK1]
MAATSCRRTAPPRSPGCSTASSAAAAEGPPHEGRERRPARPRPDDGLLRRARGRPLHHGQPAEVQRQGGIRGRLGRSPHRGRGLRPLWRSRAPARRGAGWEDSLRRQGHRPAAGRGRGAVGRGRPRRIPVAGGVPGHGAVAADAGHRAPPQGGPRRPAQHPNEAQRQLLAGLAQHRAEADVPRPAVGRARRTGRRPVAEAVVVRAEVRAALDDVLGETRFGRIVGQRLRRAFRIGAQARPVPVAGPLPDIAGHVEEPVTVRGIAPDRGGLRLVTVLPDVFDGEYALPGVGLRTALRRGSVAPGVACARQAAAGGVLPLGLRRQVPAEPAGVGERVLVGHVDDGPGLLALDRAAGPGRMAPVRAGRDAPPAAGIVRLARRAHEHQRGRPALLRAQVLIGDRVQRPLGQGPVAGGRHEPREGGVGHLRPVDPEGPDSCWPLRPLLGQDGGRALAELAAGDPHHAGGRAGRRQGRVGQARARRLGPLARGRQEARHGEGQEAPHRAQLSQRTYSSPGCCFAPPGLSTRIGPCSSEGQIGLALWASCSRIRASMAFTRPGSAFDRSRRSVGSSARLNSQTLPSASLLWSFQSPSSTVLYWPLRQNSVWCGRPAVRPWTCGSRSTPSTVRSAGISAPAAAAAVAKMSTCPTG